MAAPIGARHRKDENTHVGTSSLATRTVRWMVLAGLTAAALAGGPGALVEFRGRPMLHSALALQTSPMRAPEPLFQP